jgi:hypothetical protein
MTADDFGDAMQKQIASLEAYYDACLFEIVHASRQYLLAQDEERPVDADYWREVLQNAHQNHARVEEKLGFAYAKLKLGLGALNNLNTH